jgi:hypothetical protein
VDQPPVLQKGEAKMQVPIPLDDLLGFGTPTGRHRSPRVVKMLERFNAKLPALHGGAAHIRIFGYFIAMPEDVFADVTFEALLDAEAAWEAGKPFDVLSHVCAMLDDAFERCLQN